MKKLICALVVILVSPTLLAAIPPAALGTSNIEMALQLPLENRIPALKKQGAVAVAELQKLAFDSKQGLQSRWRAITALGKMYPPKAQPILDKALKSKEWFLRNAATIALAHGDRNWALKKAKVMLDDPALVVRTAAVNTIAKHNGKELSKFLWHKLYSSENYRHGKSLWVRRHIAQTLSKFAGKGDEHRFVALLKDKDSELHPFAVAGLEKIMNHQTRAKTVKEKRRVWLAWWSRYS